MVLLGVVHQRSMSSTHCGEAQGIDCTRVRDNTSRYRRRILVLTGRLDAEKIILSDVGSSVIVELLRHTSFKIRL